MGGQIWSFMPSSRDILEFSVDCRNTIFEGYRAVATNQILGIGSCYLYLGPSLHDAQAYKGSAGERERERAAQEVCRPANGIPRRRGPQDHIGGLAGGSCWQKVRRRNRQYAADRRLEMSTYAAAAAERK